MDQIVKLTQKLSSLYKDRIRFQEGIQSHHGLTIKIGGSEIELGEITEERMKSHILGVLDERIDEIKKEMIKTLQTNEHGNT